MAMTADGKIDTVEREGARISGPADTVRVDRNRAEADAVLVGGRTLLREDPRLTVRDAGLLDAREQAGRPRQPMKVAMVSRVGAPGDGDALPTDSRFLHDGGGRVVVFTTGHTGPEALEWLAAGGATVIRHEGARVDLGLALADLHDMGVERLMVEGGSTLVASMLEAGLVDEIQLALAPLLFGGETAPTPVGGAGWPAADARRLRLAEVDRSDDDDVIVRYLVEPEAA
jgi:5-amino-6-(5-phosphoribosylamino)uracil reductase